jgi:hypothetical protein
MEKVSYSVDQIKKIISLLNQISVKGDESVLSLAMAYQELNSGEVIKENEKDGE